MFLANLLLIWGWASSSAALCLITMVGCCRRELNLYVLAAVAR